MSSASAQTIHVDAALFKGPDHHSGDPSKECTGYTRVQWVREGEDYVKRQESGRGFGEVVCFVGVDSVVERQPTDVRCQSMFRGSRRMRRG